MRIVGGKFKGNLFKTKIPKNIRPTSDFVREAIFDTLSNFVEFNSTNVLDLFAGTGMLGIESLSRGANFCHFVDKDSDVVKIISSNLALLPIPKERYRITKADVFSFLRTYSGEIKFDLIFSDPPYNLPLNQKLLSSSNVNKIAKTGTLFVIELSQRTDLEVSTNFRVLRKKQYGDTLVYIFQYVS